MAFFTTVTTHQPYIKSSYYGDLYKEEYEKMGYSTPVSRYFSKMKVLDNALGILLDNLEEKQVLEDTVIVLTADHYPYGLKDDYLSEFLDGEFDDYEAERTPFVIYNPSNNDSSASISKKERNILIFKVLPKRRGRVKRVTSPPVSTNCSISFVLSI